ncbi:retrovirus-related pol polyprotein from transposon TNT 1-94 [Tanacetum coccineum]|uniref:Retrovirus-related pol polyprotein from transposon TNT 1-94 n=1 Tax=Tanacetum coccineum TaxID=301880 RepID=A0ABQ4ZMR0_9ASTR
MVESLFSNRGFKMVESLFSKFKEGKVRMLSVKDHKQMLQPKRRRDVAWFKEKVLLVQVQSKGKELDEEQLAFLADPGVADDQMFFLSYAHVNKATSFYDNTHKQALGYQNPFYLKRAQQIKPILYDGNVLSKTHDVLSVVDEEDTLILAEEIRLKCSNKNSKKPSTSNTPVKIEVPSELPRCLELEAELVEKNNVYIKLSRWFSNLKQHFISLEVSMQLNKEFFQKDKSSDNQNNPEIQEYFEQNDLKAQLQAKDTVIGKLKETIHSLRENVNPAKVKQDIDEIETVNIELEDSVAKLLSENEKLHKEKEHLKQTYKELYDSIKLTHVHAKDKKLKGKTVIDTVVSKPHATTIAQGMFKLDLEPLAPKVLKNKDAHLNYIKHFREHADTLRDIVESAKALSPLDSNLDSTCKVIGSTGASGSKFTGNTKNNRISQSSSSNKTNKVEDQSRSVKSRKNKKNRVAKTKCNDYVMQSMLNANSKSICAIHNECLFDANHDKCVLDYVHDVNVLSKSKPVKCKNKKHVVQIVLWYLDSICSKHMTENRSQLTNFVNKFLCTVKLGNDQIAKIIGVDLLIGSRETNLYTLSIGNMIKSSPICLLSKASNTKSWLWHRCLSHLNFGSINQLAKQGLVKGLPKLKFEKDHMCSACSLVKSNKQSHKPKSKDTNQEKLCLLHIDLCGPMRIESINGKKYILLNIDDYSRFTWVKFLRSKDEAPEFIIKFLKMIKVRLNATVMNIHTDNEAISTTCYTQNHSLICLRYGLTPYELLHNRKPDISYLHVFGSLCYPTNDSEDLSKLKAKADVDFDELTAMASEQSSSGPDTLLQPLFDEYFRPPPCVDHPVPEVAAPVHVVSAGILSSTLVDQDAPSPSTSQTLQESPSHVIPPGAKEEDQHIKSCAHG